MDLLFLNMLKHLKSTNEFLHCEQIHVMYLNIITIKCFEQFSNNYIVCKYYY